MIYIKNPKPKLISR